MTRHFLVILITLGVAGCQSAGPRVQICPEHAKKLNLALTGPVAADGADGLYLATAKTLMRYDRRGDRIENVLNDPCPTIRDIAVTPDGVVLVLRPRELSAYMAGYLVTLYPLPGEARALSCDREFAYVLTTRGEGARLLRIRLAGETKGTMQPILTTEGRPQDLCAVRGGCLVVSGGNIFKVTDPVAGKDKDQSQVAIVLLVAMQEPIISVAADQGRRIVYFATKDMSYAWIKGEIVPVFPAGSRLAWAGDTLTICRPALSDGQLIQIPGVSRHTRTLLEELTQNTH